MWAKFSSVDSPQLDPVFQKDCVLIYTSQQSIFPQVLSSQQFFLARKPLRNPVFFFFLEHRREWGALL